MANDESRKTVAAAYNVEAEGSLSCDNDAFRPESYSLLGPAVTAYRIDCGLGKCRVPNKVMLMSRREPHAAEVELPQEARVTWVTFAVLPNTTQN